MPYKFSRNTLICALFVANGAMADGFAKIPNAAISGYNDKHLTSVTVDDCKQACVAEDSFYCQSFDYFKYSSECDLSSASAESVGGLYFTYSNNPYDHYARVALTPTYTNKLVEKDVLADENNRGFSIDKENYNLEWLDFDKSRELTATELADLLNAGWRFATAEEVNELFTVIVLPLTTYQSGEQYYCDNRTAPCEAGWNQVFSTAYTQGSVGFYPSAYPNGLAQYFVYDNQATGYTGAFHFSDTVWDGYASKDDTSYPTYQYYSSPYDFVTSQMSTYGVNNNRFATLVRVAENGNCSF